MLFFENISASDDGGNDNKGEDDGCKAGGYGNKPTRYRGKRKVGDTQQST